MEKYTIDIKGSKEQFCITGLHVGDCRVREFEFCLTQGGEPLFVSESSVATLFALLPDKETTVYAPCRAEGGSVVFAPDEKETFLSLTALPGEVECEIRIVFEDDRVITTPRFTIDVSDILQNDSAIEAHSDFSALNSALTRVLTSESGLESKIGRVLVATEGNIPLFNGEGSISDEGLSKDMITRTFVFEFTEKGTETDTKNKENFADFKDFASLNGKYNVFIMGENGALFPCTVRKLTNVRYVFSALGIDDSTGHSNYFNISLSTTTSVYNKKTFFNNDFEETDSTSAATQEATANWVKALIDDTIVKGEW